MYIQRILENPHEQEDNQQSKELIPFFTATFQSSRLLVPFTPSDRPDYLSDKSNLPRRFWPPTEIIPAMTIIFSSGLISIPDGLPCQFNSWTQHYNCSPAPQLSHPLPLMSTLWLNSYKHKPLVRIWIIVGPGVSLKSPLEDFFIYTQGILMHPAVSDYHSIFSTSHILLLYFWLTQTHKRKCHLISFFVLKKKSGGNLFLSMFFLKWLTLLFFLVFLRNEGKYVTNVVLTTFVINHQNWLIGHDHKKWSVPN